VRIGSTHVRHTEVRWATTILTGIAERMTLSITQPAFARREPRAALQALAAAVQPVDAAAGVDDAELLVAAAPAA
jgi:hypothetical protein